jgi:hypothetical protein
MSAADEWPLRAALLSATQGHAKALAQLIELLRSDYPLTAEDKCLLADLIVQLTTTKSKKAERRPAPLFSETWHVREAAKEARWQHEMNPDLTLEEWASRVCASRILARRVAQSWPHLPSDDAERLLADTEDFTSKVVTELRRSRSSKKRNRHTRSRN